MLESSSMFFPLPHVLLPQRMVIGGILLIWSCGLAGCTGGPAPLEVPPLQPEKAAKAALTEYDKNGDGSLSLDELEACPGMLKAIKVYDKNNDKQISEAELIERFALWADGGVAVTTLACHVTLNGQQLDGARIEMVPEKFLADVIHPATGVANQKGFAFLGMDTAFLPEDMRNTRGMLNQGIYQIKITHPDVSIPEKYNTNTILGKEISAETGESVVRWDLKS